MRNLLPNSVNIGRWLSPRLQRLACSPWFAATLFVIVTTAQAAAPPREFQVLESTDQKVCDYFKVHTESAPIKWERLPDTSGAENYRAAFDFENTGKPMEVHRREDPSFVFGGTYFVVAPQGFQIPPDWFETLDKSTELAKPPAPMRLYVQEDMNTNAEIARFNNHTYLRTAPLKEELTFVMILEPKNGKLNQICKLDLVK